MSVCNLHVRHTIHAGNAGEGCDRVGAVLVKRGHREIAPRNGSAYQDMAKRGQYFSRLALRHNLTPDERDAYLIRSSISDGAHDDLIARNSAQASLFAETA